MIDPRIILIMALYSAIGGLLALFVDPNDDWLIAGFLLLWPLVIVYGVIKKATYRLHGRVR